MIKQRKRKCGYCRTPFLPFNSLVKWCSIECGVQLSKDKLAKKQKDDFRAKDVKTLRRKAQEIFNKYIRLRDSDDGCISCRKPKDWVGQWHAGHYLTVGANPELRFNEDNCHKQCGQCNFFKSANLTMYRIKLKKKIGIERLEALEVKGKPIRLRAEDYHQKIAAYQAKIKQLKKGK